MPDQSLLARLQRLYATADPSPSLQAVAQDHLLRLLRPWSAQTIATSPDNTPTATLSLNKDSARTAEQHASAPSLRTACAFPVTSGETMTPSTSPSMIDSRSSTQAFEGWRAHLHSEPPLDRVGRLEVLNDVSGHELRVFRKSPCPPRRRNSTQAFEGWQAHLSSEPPLNLVGRSEVLNDVSGRELRVFRKSPCPPRRRNSPTASDDDALE